MEAQCSEEADNTCRQTLRYRCKRMLRRILMPTRRVQTTHLADDCTLADQTIKFGARESVSLQLGRTNDTLFLYEFEYRSLRNSHTEYYNTSVLIYKYRRFDGLLTPGGVPATGNCLLSARQ